MPRKIISIKVECGEDEERILNHLIRFCKDNFRNKAEISVTGKEKTLYFPKIS